jgi:branched-subunit amino acid aminotransferase/4-amino-4-deoxychorismate lyase
LLAHTYEIHPSSGKSNEPCVELTTSRWRDVPAASLPKHFKHRSRLHYYLAEQDAELRRPGTQPLLCNERGEVCDSSRAAILMASSRGWIAPPAEDTFHSVTVEVIEAIAAEQGLALERRPIALGELTKAREVLWVNTPRGICAVSHIDGVAIGDGGVGSRCRELQQWYRQAAERSA